MYEESSIPMTAESIDSSIRSSSGGDPSLLLVDDDASFLRVMTRSLSHLGYAVWPARSKKEAIDAIFAIEPDYAVIDLHLGQENGLDILALLRDHSPETKSVILSGYANLETAVSSIKLGALDCLPKPMNAEELHHCFQQQFLDRNSKRVDIIHPNEARLQHILAHWEKNNRNTTQTAYSLRMNRRTMQRILKSAGMSREANCRLENPSRFSKLRRLYQVWSRQFKENTT